MSENVARIRKISAAQNRALCALLEGASQQEAAQAANVNPRTIQRWLEDNTAFYDELSRRKSVAVNSASVRLAGGMDKAIDTMLRIMEDKEAPYGVRLRASNYYLSHALRVLELADILTRLDELEKAVKRA